MQNLLSPNESDSLWETWLTNIQATWLDGIEHKIPAICSAIQPLRWILESEIISCSQIELTVINILLFNKI